MDLLSAIKPKAVLFLGKCGGVKHRAEIGDLILPIAAIRGEGASNDYFPPEVPALPAFALQKAISTTIRDHARDYWTGTIYTIAPDVVNDRHTRYFYNNAGQAWAVLDAAEALGVEPANLGVRRPTLEDVFLDLTGRALRD